MVFSTRHEWAEKIADIIGRRTRLAYLDKAVAVSTIPTVAALMAEELGWDDERAAREIEDAHRYLTQFVGQI